MKTTDLLPAPNVISVTAAEGKWDQEHRAFLRLQPSLLRTHRDQYVAVCGGKVVDSGKDKIALCLRVYAKLGYVPVYVGRVSSEPLPVVRIPTPRRQRKASVQ